MIIKGRTLEQIIAATALVDPLAIVKMKPYPTGPLHYSGYISVVKSADYRTAKGGSAHPWAPCWHFYYRLMTELQKQDYGTAVSITLHKFILKPWNANTKAHSAVEKAGLMCYHHSLWSDTGKSQASIDASWETPSLPAQPAPVVKPSGKPLTFTMLAGEPIEPGQTVNVKDVRNKVRPIHAAIASVYILEECKIAAFRIPSSISSEIPDHLLMRASHAVQWGNRVRRYADHFAHGLARNLFDYLTMAAFGEARYGQGKKYTFDVPGMKLGRSQAYQSALAYDPRDLLPKLAYAFNHYSWGGSYGGKKWGEIATSAALYFQPEFRNTPIAFVDHCFDLAHNGNLAFDKGYIMQNPSDKDVYLQILDEKRAGSLLDTLTPHPIFPPVADFLMTGVSLGLIRRPKAQYKIVADVEVPALTWGDKTVDLYHGAHSTIGMAPTTDDDADEDSTPSPQEDMPRESYPVR